MAVGLVEELDAARRGEPLEALQDIGAMTFQLVESHSGEGEGNPESASDYRDRIFTISPQVEIEFNMTEWFKINVGAGYRIVTGIDATYLDNLGNSVNFYENGDFNSPVGTVTLIFGGHKKKN